MSNEVQDVAKELNYFKELVKKLESVVGGVDGDEREGEGGEANEAATSNVPGGGVERKRSWAKGMVSKQSSFAGDQKKHEILELAVQSFTLLRHFCDKVKVAHAHEAVHAHDDLHGTALDPLLTLHHPLKDNWHVGKVPDLDLARPWHVGKVPDL